MGGYCVTQTCTPAEPTTEQDHLLQLRDSLRILVADCRELATAPSQGVVYRRFRRELKQVQHLCERVVFDRGDGRWSKIPLILSQVHQQAGDWLRGFYPRERFTMLADMLAQLEKHVIGLQTRATGRLGAIWAKPLRGAEATQGRAVQVLAGERLTQGGVIVPAAMDRAA